MTATYRPDRLKEYVSQNGHGRASKRNIEHWAKRASEHSTQHSMHESDKTGCQSPEWNQDLPTTPGTGKVKNFKT